MKLFGQISELTKVIWRKATGYAVTLEPTDATVSDATVSIPDPAGSARTLVTTNHSQTLTNKTLDADLNTISNIENADIKAAAAIDATKIANGSVSNTEFQYLDGVTSSIQTQLNTAGTDLSNHLSDATDAHDASAISNVPAGSISATDVQAALNELDTEKQPIDADLTALAALATTGLIARTGAGTVATRTITGSATVDVDDGDGVAANPTLSVIEAGLTLNNIGGTLGGTKGGTGVSNSGTLNFGTQALTLTTSATSNVTIPSGTTTMMTTNTNQSVSGIKTLTNGAIASDNVTFATAKGIESQSAASTLNVGTTNNTTTLNLGTGSSTQTVNIGTGAGVTTINIGGSGDTVNISGTLTTVNTTNLDVTDKLITLNDGGAAASGDDSGIQVEENASNTAFVKTGNSRNSWTLKAPATAGVLTLTPGANNTAFNASGGTLTFPNVTGNVITSADTGTVTTNMVANDIQFTNAQMAALRYVDASKTGTSNSIGLDTNVTTYRLTSLTGLPDNQLNTITGAVDGDVIVLVNELGASADLVIANNSGANGIYTGTGTNISVKSNGSVSLVFDATSSRWNLVGGAGSGGLNSVYVETTLSAAAGNNYLADTTTAGFTATLPLGSEGAVIGFIDARETWGTNNLTIAPATGQAIDGYAVDEVLVLNVSGTWVKFHWIPADSTPTVRTARWAIETAAPGSSNQAIVQGGNTLGANMVIGTNDNFSFNIETNGTTKVAVGANGILSVSNGSAGGAVQARFNSTNPPGSLSYFCSNGNPYLGFNTSQTPSTDGQTYTTTNPASRVVGPTGSGALTMDVAASGTAGNAITWINALTASSAGAVTLGASGSAVDHVANGRTFRIPLVSNTATSLALGQSGGNYPSIAYNALPATTTYQYTRQATSQVSLLVFGEGYAGSPNGAFDFHAFSSAAAGTITASSSSSIGGASVAGAWTLGPASAADGTVEHVIRGNSSSDPALRIQNQVTGASASNSIVGAQYSVDTDCTGGRFFVALNSAGGVVMYADAVTNTTGNWVSTSDARLKEDFQSFEGLTLVNQMLPKNYKMKDSNKRFFGFVAQELQAVVPNAVSVGNDDVAEDGSLLNPWGIDYGKLTPILAKAIQELNAKIEAQAQEIQILKGGN